VGELSSAAAELVATSNQQSASMAEQSSALQQMSSTLDELRAIVHQASDKARSVVGVSEHSLAVSDSGQQALEVALGSMQRIHEQIDSVTHSILELSQRTQQIGEITESVRDIAEQSNLLAVNAAVEAAKAGEAGRGFGVVAIEVKSLATQSKKATGTVRAILNEIQQATTSTVMGIEEGNKRVQAGVSGVQQVGDDIRQLYGIIEEACDANRQIASVTHQQVTGIEQLALAVKSIAEVARELVSATHQQNATAQALSTLASSIDQIVARYQLPEAV
jgi:methyl-accepting chemotaxis protein